MSQKKKYTQLYRKDIIFVGVDYWSRPVYKHVPTNSYLCEIDDLVNDDDDEVSLTARLATTQYLHTKCPQKDFEGEPDFMVELVDEKDTES